MRVILLPIFKLIMILVLILVNLVGFLFVQAITFFWSFKFEKYSEYFTNKRAMVVDIGLQKEREDKNVFETLSRWWNLDFYPD